MPSNEIIKQISTDTDTYSIGADAVNIDWDEEGTISLVDVIGSNINTETSISTKITAINELLSDLQQNVNDLTLNNTMIQALSENIVSFLTTLEQIKNNQEETINTKLQNKKFPVGNIQWEYSDRNLREILGDLNNIPTDSVRKWLDFLASKKEKTNTWRTISEDLTLESNDLIEPINLSIDFLNEKAFEILSEEMHVESSEDLITEDEKDIFSSDQEDENT